MTRHLKQMRHQVIVEAFNLSLNEYELVQVSSCANGCVLRLWGQWAEADITALVQSFSYQYFIYMRSQIDG